MAVNISKLKKEQFFKNEKIKIMFGTGDISNSLSVYLIDVDGKSHHILWEISPDRNFQNFDKSNDKIRSFVTDKINEWISIEEQAEVYIKEQIKKRENREENELKKLSYSF